MRRAFSHVGGHVQPGHQLSEGGAGVAHAGLTGIQWTGLNKTLVAIVLSPTLGMMLANAPVVWLGDKLVKKVPIRMVHIMSAGIFLVLGVLALLSKDVPALA